VAALAIGLAPRLTAALRHAALRPFWLAQLFTYLAQQGWQTALLWALVRDTRSAVVVSLGLVALNAPVIGVGLLGPARVAGRRPLAHLATAAALVLAGAAVAAARLAPVAATIALVAAALVEGTLVATQIPLLQADLARAVRARSLTTANSAMEFASGLGGLTGPLLAGWALSGPGLAVALLAAAAVMGGAAPAVAAWQRRSALGRSWDGAGGPPSAPASGLLAGLRRAMPYVTGDAFLRTALATRTVNNVLWPAVSVALPLLAATRWHAGPAGYGALLAARAVGSLGGTALAARLGPGRLARAFFVAWLVEGAAFSGIAMSPVIAPALACMALAGVVGPLGPGALDSRIGRAVDQPARGSVFGLQRTATGGAGLVGTLAAGVAMAVAPAGPVLALSGAAIFACALAGYGAAARAGALAAVPGVAQGGGA
jgi:hypothetical protein